MDHETSIKTQAAEKYLLGELPPQEREEFERHFFDCSECAEDVRAEFQFKEAARAVFSEGPAPELPHVRQAKRGAWLGWMRPSLLAPVAACMLIGAFSLYQNAVQIPALRSHMGQLEQPQLLAPTPVLAPSSRGAVKSITVSSTALFFPVSLALGPIPAAESYRCDLQSESGRTLWTIRVPKLDPDANLNLLFPARGVPSGYYQVVLLGNTGGTTAALDSYHIAIRRE